METEQYIKILDQIDVLNHLIIDTNEFKNYIRTKSKLEMDSNAQMLIYQFKNEKENFETIERFGKYHPDFSTGRRRMLKKKRAMDNADAIIEFRRAEYQLQSLLDEVLYEVSIPVSQHVNIVSSNPFFTTHSTGCSSGGSCQCVQ